ncbi:MAG: hypothetical protein JXB30_17195 [Anaerolineae bacterium]|nr:hypothetical protein [Anaerolineae bacterium]
MSATYYEIDNFAKTLLLEAPNHRNLLNSYQPDSSDPDFVRELHDRVMNLSFDCLPNWGINGLRDCNEIAKQNWFFLDPQQFSKAWFRYRCLDHALLRLVIASALEDILGIRVPILGIGVYGSYLYGQDDHFDDIDVLVIVDSSVDVALDAIRYRDRRLSRITRAPCEPECVTNELGMTIIGETALNSNNHSFIVTEAALLDATITLSSGLCINVPPLTPFLMALNARKLVKWAASEILDNPTKTLSLIDQAAKLRTMMYHQFPSMEFRGDGILGFAWAVKESIDRETLLERCNKLMKLVLEDEDVIRQTVCASLW